jgi:hypothetical protein
MDMAEKEERERERERGLGRIADRRVVLNEEDAGQVRLQETS